MEGKCPRCDFPVLEEDKYCGGCGFRVAERENYQAKTQVEMQLSDIRINLGKVYLKKGDYAKAAESFEKVLEEDPENTEARALLNSIRSKISEM